MNKTKNYAISQIFLLVLSLFAIAFIIGEADKVNAFNTECNVGIAGDSLCQAMHKDSSYSCIDGECVKEQVTSTNSETDKKENFGKEAGKTALNTGLSALAGQAVNKYVFSASKTSGMIKLAGLGKVSETAVLTEAENLIAAGKYTEAHELIQASNAGVLKQGAFSKFLTGAFKSGALKGSSGWTSVGYIATYAAIAVAAGLLARFIAPMFGASVEQAQVIGYTTGAAVFGGLVVAALASGPWGWAAGAAIAIVGILGFYKKESLEVVAFQCLPYSAPKGGEKCELCNNQDVPCSEYQCKSLGRGCELVNKGTTEELCIFSSRGDITEPEIQPWQQVLTDGFVYNPIEVLPGERGARITTLSGECVPPFTQIRFGVTLNEPARCKISTNRSNSYEEMGKQYLSYGYDTYNHSMTISFPDKASVEAEGYNYDEGFNEWFIRCEDVAGNSNTANFVFRFCVDESPDLSPPSIVTSSPLNNAPIGYNVTTLSPTFYLNKPAECKWDYLDKTYGDMSYEMSCADELTDATAYNNQMLYPCDATLSGLVNYEKNKFYIRCKSYPLKENEAEKVVMEKSYEYVLQGTRQLEITEITPNETVSSSSDTINVPLEVRTIGGYDEGKSVCYYSLTTGSPKWVMFYETNSYIHKQNLWFSPGAHDILVRCIDNAGNTDTEEITLNVESDTVSPLIARAYYEDGYLKLVTNEEAECVYSLFDCEYAFEDGVLLTTSENLNHFTLWDTTLSLYVKCQDIYLNRPARANECSIVVRAEDFVSPQEEA